MQLAWLYTMMASMRHIEGWRLDEALGDFFAHDIDNDILTEKEALDMVRALWAKYSETGDMAVCRIVVGGAGRRNEETADRFALAAMEATRLHKQVTPQLTLRIYKGQNPKLLKKAFDVLSEGGVFPLLYNDDVVIPGVARVLNVSKEAAIKYHPLGCGEYMLAHGSPSMLTIGWSIPKSIEAVLYNGKGHDGAEIGLETGKLETFDTYEKLYAAFLEQVKFAADLTARVYQHTAEELPKQCVFLMASLLNDDCLGRGKGFMDGGALCRGACVMGHGFTNAADSLVAIRKLVYEEKRVTLKELAFALHSNFEGQENLRKQCLAAPKFGNDLDEADQVFGETVEGYQCGRK